MDRTFPLTPFSTALLFVLLALALLPLSASANSSILIWPVDPVIEQDQNASALWLENRGEREVLMQVRVFDWRQENGRERFSQQDEIIASPPMLTVQPGQKQLIRLTRPQRPANGVERAYRIIIDEIPSATPVDDVTRVAFQVRYSLPLFSYGEGLRSVALGQSDPRYAPPVPALSWREVSEGGAHYFEVSNDSDQHARLTATSLRDGERTLYDNPALQGYVLPHSRMRWPMPPQARGATTLRAVVNGGAPETLTRTP